MDLQRAAGGCETVGRFPQLASEFSSEAQVSVGRIERFIPLSILSAQTMTIPCCDCTGRIAVFGQIYMVFVGGL